MADDFKIYAIIGSFDKVCMHMTEKHFNNILEDLMYDKTMT